MFLISSILYHHPALLHRHTLILDHCWLFSWLSRFLSWYFSFLYVFPIAVYPFLRLISWNYDQSLVANHWKCGIKCCGLSQPSCLLVCTIIIVILTYLRYLLREFKDFDIVGCSANLKKRVQRSKVKITSTPHVVEKVRVTGHAEFCLAICPIARHIA